VKSYKQLSLEPIRKQQNLLRRVGQRGFVKAFLSPLAVKNA
jgi:hypothetical protein